MVCNMFIEIEFLYCLMYAAICIDQKFVTRKVDFLNV